ncbi:MAG: RING-HC finger protein [Clostridia bacterium]|nr:RING-HC finger protein [Clostridia bacterium]
MKYFKFSRFFGTVFGTLFLLGNATIAMESQPTIAPDPIEVMSKINNPCEICRGKEAKYRVVDDKAFCDPKKVCGAKCAEKFINDCRKDFGDPGDFKIYFNGLDSKSECIICGDDSSFKNISLIVPCGHQYMCSNCWVKGKKEYKCPICKRGITNNLNGPIVWQLVLTKYIENEKIFRK